MPADIFYTGGTGHDHCQDYACMRQKTSDGHHIVAVSDGCSSVPLSHVGAMLLSHTACMESATLFSVINDRDLLNAMLKFYINNLLHTTKNYGIPSTALTATLLLMHEYDDGVYALIIGDGMLYGRARDGGAMYIQRIFKSGAPYYLVYHQSDDMLREYKDAFGCTSSIIEQSIYGPNNVYKTENNGDEIDDLVLSYFFPRNIYESVTICTDGILSFMPYQDPLCFFESLTAFKSNTGYFLDRRVKRILKEYKRNEITHFDDLGMGTILL